MAVKCAKCKQDPSNVNGMIMCSRCGITARTEKMWDAFMSDTPQVQAVKGVRLVDVINEMERPINTLKAVAALTDDDGIRRLAGGCLLGMQKLDLQAYFTDPELCKKVEARIHALVAGYSEPRITGKARPDKEPS